MNRTFLTLLTWGTVMSAVIGALALAHAMDQRRSDVTPDSRQASAERDTGRFRAMPTGSLAAPDTHSWGMVGEDARP